MAAGSKEKELEGTLPGAEEAEVSAEASELRRRLLAVASNDSAERQRSATGTFPPAAGEQLQSDGRAFRATLQFVRRRPAGNEEVSVTAVSGAPLPSREASAPQAEAEGGDVAARPSRARIVVPLVAGVLLVLVALIHRTLSTREPAQASSLAAPKAAGLMVPPPRLDVPTPRRAARGSAKNAGSASSLAPPSPVAEAPRSAGDEAARLLVLTRSKAQRSDRTPAPRETRAAEASAVQSSSLPSNAPTSIAPLIKAAPTAEPTRMKKPRPRLVDDSPRPGLLD